jgi:carboxymethylenebutenolidase
MSNMIDFIRPDGKTAPGYLSLPAQGKGAPGVVMVEEWWGVDERIKATADRLAGAGFAVLVPDLFRGRTAAVGDEANHLVEGLDFNDAATQDLVGAATYLRERGASRVGVMGFCIGGALALLSVMKANPFDAAVTWYGLPPREAGDPASIRIPVQGHWALQDGFFKPADVDALEKELKQANADVEFFRYDAQHGFFNQGTVGAGGLGHYNAEAAEAAWKRTVDFFNRTLY